MKATTRISWQIETMTVLEHEWSDWSGTWELAKGAGKADEQRKQELGMQQKAFDAQMAQLNQLKGAFSKYLGGKIGYDPQALASMRSQFLNANTAGFNQAGQNVREALGARGEGSGQLPVGGDYTRGIAGLMGARAGSQAQGLLGLDVQNQQMALQNAFNSGNLLSGNAATLTGTQGVAGAGASSALGDYIRAANSGFGSSFMQGLGGSLGGGLGSFATGGFGSLGSNLGRMWSHNTANPPSGGR